MLAPPAPSLSKRIEALLAAEPRLSVGDIAERLQVEHRAIAARLHKMHARGLLLRLAAPNRRRGPTLVQHYALPSHTSARNLEHRAEEEFESAQRDLDWALAHVASIAAQLRSAHERASVAIRRANAARRALDEARAG